MASILGRLNEIFSRSKKNWLEKLDQTELEIEKRKLELEADRLAKEVIDFEEKKVKLFNDGLGKSILEKRIIAQKIKELDVEARIKYLDFDRKQKMSRALFNIINILKRKEHLNQRGLWPLIQGLTPEQLLTELSRVEIKDKDFDRAIEDVVRALERPVSEWEEVDPETQKIMNLWTQVEEKEMAPEEVTKRLSVEEKLKEKELA